MIELNVDRLIDQLCAANHTNGQMIAELEAARKEIKSLKEVNESLCNKVQNLDDQLKSAQESVDYWFAEAKKNSPADKSHEGE